MLCWPYNHVNQPWADTRCLPLEPTPRSRLGCGRVPDWAPCVTPQLPLSYVSPVVTPVSQVTPSYVAPRSLPVAVWQVCSVRPCLCPSPMDGFISTVLLGPTCAVLGLLARSCPALCDPVDYSPPGTSIHGASPGKNARFYIYIYIHWSEVKSLSRVRLFMTPWTVAHQAPPSMGFSRQAYWSGVPFPSPEDLPHPGIEPGSPTL